LKNKSLKTYASLARIGFPKSYSAKIMLVVKHKVEALNQALRKWDTQEGLGSQWCNRLPCISLRKGEEGVVIGMCFSPPT
jgi:hypothetical protein